jgi:hypothetical protein
MISGKAIRIMLDIQFVIARIATRSRFRSNAREAGLRG